MPPKDELRAEIQDLTDEMANWKGETLTDLDHRLRLQRKGVRKRNPRARPLEAAHLSVMKEIYGRLERGAIG